MRACRIEPDLRLDPVGGAAVDLRASAADRPGRVEVSTVRTAEAQPAGSFRGLHRRSQARTCARRAGDPLQCMLASCPATFPDNQDPIVDAETTLTLRIVDYASLSRALAFGLLAAGFGRVWIACRLGSAALAAAGFGLSALLSLWTFGLGYWWPYVAGPGDLGAAISRGEWYALMAVELLWQLPLIIGAVAALICLSRLPVRPATDSGA